MEIDEKIEIEETVTRNIETREATLPSATSSSDAQSLILSPNLNSATSSVSSILPPSAAIPLCERPEALSQVQSASKEEPIQNESQTPRQRLEARITHLRAERRADGPDGRPARNRQELLDQRRKKEEERRAAKKEQRRKQKEEERRKQDEEIAKRFSPGGSGSLLASPRSPIVDANTATFSFGRVAFSDGTQVTSFDDASSASIKKHKGPSDPATALKAAQAKAARVAGYDESKRADITQKDMWLSAKRRAHGERVRDDVSLLKKALKRQQATKKRSETQWQSRLEGVQKSQEARQRKRAENIAKRREDKIGKGKKKRLKRPGFEGSFKGRTG